VVVTAALVSLSRILALWAYYHSPLSVVADFQLQELPRLLNDTGLLPPPPLGTKPDDLPSIDLSPIKEFELRLCLSKEWHRFPGHYLIPDGIRVDFVKSEFDGLLPGHFGEHGVKVMSDGWWLRECTRDIPNGLNDLNQEDLRHYVCTLRFLVEYSLAHLII
jgi:alpha-1,2-mannosyltransferase